MPTYAEAFRKTTCRTVLFAALTAALDPGVAGAETAPAHSAPASSAFDLPTYLRAKLAEGRKADPSQPWTNPPHVVDTCADDGSAGSLRSIIESPSTVSGDLVDLTQLPMMCSVITLQNSAIRATQDELYLQGPGADHLTIDAAHNSSVFYHYGNGTFFISDVNVTGGYFSGGSLANGGCIYSQGGVFLFESVVSDCILRSTSATLPAQGAGVYTRGDLTLVRSTIAGSTAFSLSGAEAYGGGAFVSGSLFLQDSTVSNNTAFALSGGKGIAGGIYASENMTIDGSTISGNSADVFGGVDQYNVVPPNATISDSTLSGNVTKHGVSGLYTDATLLLRNSTIAFNRSGDGGVGGLFVATNATIQSSVIAGNSNVNGASDLDGDAVAAVVGGASNVIVSSTLPPLPQTITTCPKLDPLLNTGGVTATHGLRLGSPALDQGSAGTLTLDQRGMPRTSGIQTDIGSVERQPSDVDERVFVGGFDGLCDQ